MSDGIDIIPARFINKFPVFSLVFQRRCCAYGQGVNYTPNGFCICASAHNIQSSITPIYLVRWTLDSIYNINISPCWIFSYTTCFRANLSRFHIPEKVPQFRNRITHFFTQGINSKRRSFVIISSFIYCSNPIEERYQSQRRQIYSRVRVHTCLEDKIVVAHASLSSRNHVLPTGQIDSYIARVVPGLWQNLGQSCLCPWPCVTISVSMHRAYYPWAAYFSFNHFLSHIF